MAASKKRTFKDIIIGVMRAALMTLLAFIFSFFLLEPLSFSALSIFSVPEKNDFSISDLYVHIANNRSVRTLDSDIVLVDVKNETRPEIAETLHKINFWNPKVVGIDILFSKNMPGDSVLVNAIKDIENVILPLGLEDVDNDRVYRICDVPFFYQQFPVVYGASNLPSKFEGGTIREFATYFPMKNGERLLSFPMALAKAYNPSCLRLINQRNKRIETIDYASRDFVILTSDDIENNGELLNDKLVIVGSISDGGDMHSTPINSYLSGLSIHAASVATILNGNFFDDALNCPPWIPACILCFLILLIREFSELEMRGLIIRFLQLLIVYAAVRIGYGLYVDKYKIFDFSYTMLMVTFGLFAVDIWLGVEYIVKWIIKKFK
ncbi:MAG: CHASE2 domain-containing protein [Muribaculaceae bacterium]|nr:CHASE2 domain-containing protein [Muribaculaceae bacterium]